MAGDGEVLEDARAPPGSHGIDVGHSDWVAEGSDASSGGRCCG